MFPVGAYSALGHAASLVTYENEAPFFEFDVLNTRDEAVWLLGQKYKSQANRTELRADVFSRLWFTYRKDFSAIGGTGPTSDDGWGCMLRCGQMMLAQALLCRDLGRDWRWMPHIRRQSESYRRILEQFLDKKDSLYSIHQMAQMGVSEGKPVGQWFGPNTVAQVLRKLSLFDNPKNLALHVAMDNTVVLSDIRLLCHALPISESVSDSVSAGKDARPYRISKSHWRPLVLFIPLRLGLSEINKVYSDSLKKCFSVRQSLGVIGGKPNHAYYFIGSVDNLDRVLYLDPHTRQATVKLFDENGAIPDTSYHQTSQLTSMKISDLDPSVALGFFCQKETDFDDMCRTIQTEILSKEERPMFELVEDRPSHWLPFEPFSPSLETARQSSQELTDVVEKSYDTDEEFELL